MKIIFLGTSHGYPEKGRFLSSALLETQGHYYMIDAGAPVITLLMNHDISWNQLDGIFITHNHNDHQQGLFGLMDWSRERRYAHKYNLEVYFPTDTPMQDYFNEKFLESVRQADVVHFHHYEEGPVFEDERVKISAVRTKHMKFSYAFVIEAEGKRVMFSGDLQDGMVEDYPQVLFEKDFDLLVLEGAHTHMDSPDIVDKVRRSRVKKLLVNHVSYEKNPPESMQSFFEKVADKFPEIPVDESVYIL